MAVKVFVDIQMKKFKKVYGQSKLINFAKKC